MEEVREGAWIQWGSGKAEVWGVARAGEWVSRSTEWVWVRMKELMLMAYQHHIVDVI